MILRHIPKLRALSYSTAIALCAVGCFAWSSRPRIDLDGILKGASEFSSDVSNDLGRKIDSMQFSCNRQNSNSDEKSAGATWIVTCRGQKDGWTLFVNMGFSEFGNVVFWDKVER